MKIITKEFNTPHFSSRIINSYLGDYKGVVFDIETTGLNPKYTKVILAGFLFESEHGVISKQFMAKNRSEEKELLFSIVDELSKFDYVITYNGRHFDMNFIQARCEHYGILFRQPLYDLDIYLFLNGYSQLRYVLPNLKQKSVENYLGIGDGRDDRISGKDSVELYRQYEETGDPILEKVIALHNSDDVNQLYKLQSILLKTDIHKGFYSLGFPATSSRFGPLQVKSITSKALELKVTGTQHSYESSDYIRYPDTDSPLFAVLDGSQRSFELTIPIMRKAGGGYVRLSDFGFTPKEFSHLPGYVNGFLVIENKGTTQYLEMIALIKHIIGSL